MREPASGFQSHKNEAVHQASTRRKATRGCAHFIGLHFQRNRVLLLRDHYQSASRRRVQVRLQRPAD